MPTINKKTNTVKQVKWQHDNKWSKFYGSKKWKLITAYFKLNKTLCVDCAAKGIYRDYKDLHHKIPFGTGQTEEEQWKLFVDIDNIIPLCRQCHLERHRQLRQGH